MSKSPEEFQAEIDELRLRLNEADETLRAIGNGEVDAFVVSSPEGQQQVFTLKGAEQPYRILVETMSEGAATLATDGTILYCNNRLASLLHVPLESIIGTQLGSYVAPADLPLFVALLDECTEKHVKNEMTMLTETGGAVPVFFSCCANDLSGNSGVCVVITDLTEQKRNEEIAASEAALRASEERLALVTSSTRIGMFDWNITSNRVLWTQTHEAIFGYAPATTTTTTTEFDISKWADRVHPDDLAFVMEESNRCMRERIPLEVQHRIIWPDGSLHWVEAKGVFLDDSDGKSSRLIGVVRDITERKQVEEALAAARRQIQSIVDNSPAIVYAFDPERRFVLANAAVAKLLNSTPAEMIGKRRHDFMPQADADSHESNDRKVIEAGRALDFEEQSELPGRSITWLTTKFPLRDAVGNIYAVGGISTDITDRKRMEDELQRSTAFNQSIIDSSNDCIKVLSLDGRLQFINLPGQRLLEINDFKPYFNIHYADFWKGSDNVSVNEVLKKAKLGQSGSFQGYCPTAKGTPKWWDVSISPILGTTGKPERLLAISRDITKRKLAEDALRESENRFRLLAETMLQGVVHQDAHGTIISMNPAAERILGKNREDFLGNSSVDVEHDTIYENGKIFPGEEHPTMVALRTGMPVRGVVMGVFNPKLKEYRWIGIDAVPVFRPGVDLPSEVYSVFGDITNRKNAETALRESEERIQQALHVSRSFTFDWLPVTDQVIRSASCAAILNLTGNEAVFDTGEHFFQSVHPDDRVRLGQILRDLTPTANTYITEYRYIRNDGSEITLEETGQASFDAAGKMLRLVGVSTDISVRKQAEEALKKVHAELESRVEERTSDLIMAVKTLEDEIHERQNAEKALYEETLERLKAVETLREKEQLLIQQNRQAAMGEMIGNIAHQWRQPLNTLGLYTQSLGVFYGMPDFDKKFLDDSIAKSMEIIQHMSKTIDDFRDYFKPEKEKADFYLIEAIKSTLSLLEGNFNNPKITIDFVVHDNPVVNGLQNEFAHVFLNILNNSRDAMIEREIADGRILITIYSEGSCAVVTVADNAGGIPEEVINKIFDPYFTTKGPQVGTGLGLFMSKTIIEKNMGGKLSVRNTDTGAEFRIEVAHGNQN